MNGFSTEEDSRDGPPAAPFYGQSCCLIDDGDRCVRPAGNASFSKRIQKSISQKKLKLDIDKSVSAASAGAAGRCRASRRGGRAGPSRHRTAVPPGRCGSARRVELPGGRGGSRWRCGLGLRGCVRLTRCLRTASACPQRSGKGRTCLGLPGCSPGAEPAFPCVSARLLKHNVAKTLNAVFGRRVSKGTCGEAKERAVSAWEAGVLFPLRSRVGEAGAVR